MNDGCLGPGYAVRGDRIAPEDPDGFGLATQRVDGLGHPGIVPAALEVAEEHVAPEAAAQRPRFDPGEVDVPARELRERLDQGARVVGAELREHERRPPRSLAAGLGPCWGDPHEAGDVVRVVLDAL